MKPSRLRDALVRMALQPRNLAKSLSHSLPGMASQSVTVVALDGQWLKLLHAEGPPRARKVAKALALPVQGESHEQIEARLKKACATEGLAAREVLLANPTHLSTIRLFSLPSTDPKEIRDIVELQAEKHTPYAKDEILTDFSVLEQERGGYSRVLLVIAHQDVITRPVRLVESCGWLLERVGCELEGLIGWFHAARRAAGGKPSAGLSLVVDVDESTTTLVMVQRGQPQFHRSLAMGIDQLEDDPQAAAERLIAELHRSVEAVESEGGAAKIAEVFLTGPAGKLEGLKAHAEQQLGVPVILLSPWEGCEVSEIGRSSIERLPDVSFAGLVGLANAPGQVDLTPPAAKLRLAFEARAKALVLLGCQLVGALILVSLLCVGRAQKELRYAQALRGLHAQTAAQAERVESTVEQLQFIEGQLRQRGQLLRAVDVLAKLSPPEVQWNSLAFALGDGVVLGGTADQLPTVYEFSGAVGASPLFGEADVRRVSKRRIEDDKDVTDFELRCPLAGPVALP
jgi:Tfp pilus assembly PilM family ATPase